MATRRFQFRLARLLRVRDVLERQAREDWSTLEMEARADAARSAARRQGLRDAQQHVADGQREGRPSAAQVLLAQVALDDQARSLRLAREAEALSATRAERAREQWSERERDRRALEELQERARRRHRVQLAAQDQAEMDEIAIQRRRARREPPATGATFAVHPGASPRKPDAN